MSPTVASRLPSPMNASSTSVCAVDPRPRKLKSQRAGHRRLRPAGVGRAVARGVAPYGPRGVKRRGARRQRGGDDEPQRGKPRRRQIDEIVEPRRRPAERGVAVVLMADHAVGGVDRLVERAAGKPAERGPEDRRDDAVGEILRQALDRRARDGGLVQHVRIAADDHRDRAASLFEARVEPLGDRADMARETALSGQARGKSASAAKPSAPRETSARVAAQATSATGAR